MKRIIFYIVLAGCIIGSTCVVLWVSGFMPLGIGTFTTGVKTLEAFIKGIINGTYRLGYSGADFFLYGLSLFIILNAAMILTMLLIFLFSGFNLNKISRFYRICTCFIISSILLSAGYLYFVIDVAGSFKINLIPFWAYVPLIASIGTMIVGIVFRCLERQK